MVLFNWLKQRAAGVLLHPTSLPSNQGIGTLGESAYRFIDFLSESRVRYWQVCPLGPTGFGDSPYQCFSSFAGNPYLIDFERLVSVGLLCEEDLERFKTLPEAYTDYAALWEPFSAALKTLIQNAREHPELLAKLGNIETFRRDNAYWLGGYALYMALKEHFSGAPWYTWEREALNYETAKSKAWPKSVSETLEGVEVVQFIFFSQWNELRTYAHRKGIEIIGDTPIFTALDSADVWQNPQIFQIDKKGAPLAVAGVPPDYFSELGQLWGNPLYDWKKLKKTNYAWWIERLRACFKLYDIVRIDHFRAFYDYWRIPAEAKDARTGKWVKGPGLEFFATIRDTLGDVRLIAEDLGDMNDGVRKLLADTGLPGMAVLEFAFGGDPKNLYLPHNLKANTIVYPGTHDNNTACGWYESCNEQERDFFRRYLWTDGNAPHWALINAAMKSHANIAIVSLQDILGLGAEARFNEPGTSEKNWRWRLSREQLDEVLSAQTKNLRELIEISARA